jgi:small nuclear ribonucleoprotein (snRNP)-like protein
VKFVETTNDIITQGQIVGTDDLLNVTGLDIPADPTEGKAGAKLTDVRYGIKLGA